MYLGPSLRSASTIALDLGPVDTATAPTETQSLSEQLVYKDGFGGEISPLGQVIHLSPESHDCQEHPTKEHMEFFIVADSFAL